MVNSGVNPNVKTFGVLISSLANSGLINQALEMLSFMRTLNVAPDAGFDFQLIYDELILHVGVWVLYWTN